MSNVIPFPKANRENQPTQTVEQLMENTINVRKERIEHIIEDVMTDVLNMCFDHGFDLTNQHALKSTCLVVESLRCLLYRASGFDHPLAQTADQLFEEYSLPDPSNDV